MLARQLLRKLAIRLEARVLDLLVTGEPKDAMPTSLESTRDTPTMELGEEERSDLGEK